MTESLNGGMPFAVAWGASASARQVAADSAVAAEAAAPAAEAPKNCRRRMLGSQQFVAHVFQNVSGSFDANVASQNRVFIFDTEDALVVDVHVSLDDRFPKLGAVTVADGAESFRGQRQIRGFECEIQDSIFVYVVGIERGVFHVGVINGALFAEEVDDFDGIASLPEKMAEVAVGADFLTDGFAEFEKSARIIDHEIRMHFKGELVDAVFAGKFRGFFAVGDDPFFPLPVLHRGVFGGPTIGNP